MWKDIKVKGRKYAWDVQGVSRFAIGDGYGVGHLRVYDEETGRSSILYRAVHDGYTSVPVNENISQREVYRLLAGRYRISSGLTLIGGND